MITTLFNTLLVPLAQSLLPSMPANGADMKVVSSMDATSPKTLIWTMLLLLKDMVMMSLSVITG